MDYDVKLYPEASFFKSLLYILLFLNPVVRASAIFKKREQMEGPC